MTEEKCVSAVHSCTLEITHKNNRSISKFLWFKMSSLLIFLSISVPLDQFSTTLCFLHVCRLVQHWTNSIRWFYQRLSVRHLKTCRGQVLNFTCSKQRTLRCCWRWKTWSSIRQILLLKQTKEETYIKCLCLVGHSIGLNQGFYQGEDNKNRNTCLFFVSDEIIFISSTVSTSAVSLLFMISNQTKAMWGAQSSFKPLICLTVFHMQ